MYRDLPAKLRATKSESKRKLLDAAADTIERLLEDLRQSGRHDPCDYCKHSTEPLLCEGEDYVCDQCSHEGCSCHSCEEYSRWEWRGLTEGQHG